MKLQAIISSVALAAALSFAGPVVAQNTITVEIPADQVQNFKDACAALQAKSTASLATDDSDAVDPTTTASVPANETAQSDSSDPAAKDNWDELLAGLTIEQCQAGGLMPE